MKCSSPKVGTKKTSIRILGIDPGFGRMGYGVIERRDDGNWRALVYGCLETSADKILVDRISEIHQRVSELIKKYLPARLAVEKLFFSKNVRTAMSVGEARGVILLAGVNAGLPIDEFTPPEIKQAISGYGRADKGQMQKIVQITLNLRTPIKSDDAADALAVALCAGQCLWQKSCSK